MESQVLPFFIFVGIATVITLTYYSSSTPFALENIPMLSNIKKFKDEVEQQESERQRLNRFREKVTRERTFINKAGKYPVSRVIPRRGIAKQSETSGHFPDALSTNRGKSTNAFSAKLHPKVRSLYLHRFDNIQDNSNITLKVIYRDLSSCPPRPDYLPGYKAHCWTECKKNQLCNNPPTISDVKNSLAYLYCFPNLHLIGTRKCGTTDFSTIWITGLNEIERTQQDYFGDIKRCPVNYMTKRHNRQPRMAGGSIYNGGPGTIMANTKVFKNETHLMISSGIQFLSYMSTPETKFYLQLRNPADRVISYLFHWQRERRIPQYKTLPTSSFTKSFVDTLIQNLISDLEQCINRHGEVACVYLPDAHDGNLQVLLTHSMYVIYIEEMFKFIPRKQVMVKTMEEYSKNREKTATEIITRFFGVDISEGLEGKARGRIINRGQKNPILPSTLESLDDFFAPFNRRLSNLLDDPKFLFIKQRK